MRLRRCVAVVLMVSAVAGCAAAIRAEQEKKVMEAVERHHREVAELCPSDKRAQALERAHCINDSEDRVLAPVHPYNDLLKLGQAHRVSVAKRVANRSMSLEDAELEFAQIRSQIMAEIDRRHKTTQMVGAQVEAAQAQRTAAFGALLSGVAAIQEANKPPPPPPIPHSPGFTCTTFGNVTRCN